MKYLYRLYQLVVALPLFLLTSILVSLVTVVGSIIGNGHFWGYYPGKLWAWLTVRLFLLPVTVKGRENLKPGQSYVFVSNHQGAFDIFLIYGFLNRNFKWMMKHQLRKVPFIGIACEYSRKIKETDDRARGTLHDGMSLGVFPEGSGSLTGHMGVFKRGAFMLADELQLPVVPLTINGSFDVMPRMRDMHWVTWSPLSLTIHEPIYPIGQGKDNVANVEQKSYEAVMSAIDEKYQGFVENPDQ